MASKPGRNDSCPCGSGKKYKNCCLLAGAAGKASASLAAPGPLDARHLLALFEAGRYAELEALLAPLVEQQAQAGSLWGLLGATLHAQGKDGLAALQRATALSPRDFAAHSSLGRVWLERGRYAEAAESFRRALALQPEDPGTQFYLGDTLRLLGCFAAAETHLLQVLQRAPDSVAALVSLAGARAELGEFAAAESGCRRAIELAPDYADAHFCLGNVLLAGGRLQEARGCYVAALQIAPQHLGALSNLGNVLQELGQLAEAEQCYRRALQVNPADAQARVNLARLFVEQSRFAEAEECYRELLRTHSHNAELFERLGGVLVELGRQEEASDCFRQALQLDPGRVSAQLALATALLPLVAPSVETAAAVSGRFAAALGELAAALADRPAGAGEQPSAAALAAAQQPFALAYRDGDHCALLSRYADLYASCLGPQPSLTPWPRDRIRLVIASHHVRRHSVWDIVLRGLLQHLDRSRFEIFLYHFGNREDEETAWARTQVDLWRDRHSLPDASGWLAAARSDCPDVIFYPEIGMSSLAYFLAAHRLAPLQVASWGHPITTGLATIDLFLSGALLEAPDADAHYRERLIRLPGTGCCTSLWPLAAEPIPEVEAALQGYAGIRFVIAQRALKFDPADDEAFARIAVAAAPCVFVLLRDPLCPWATDQIVARLAAVFRRHGLAADERLLVIPWLAAGQFVSLLDRCDVYLDCPTFSGYTTAWQALHRGLPIVAFEGRHLRQRLAAGLLRKAGLTDHIAASLDDYVDRAAHFADTCRDAQRRGALRAGILAVAPAVDGDLTVVRAFEHCLIAALANSGQ